jgi:hypothetical protein
MTKKFSLNLRNFDIASKTRFHVDFVASGRNKTSEKIAYNNNNNGLYIKITAIKFGDVNEIGDTNEYIANSSSCRITNRNYSYDDYYRYLCHIENDQTELYDKLSSYNYDITAVVNDLYEFMAESDK